MHKFQYIWCLQTVVILFVVVQFFVGNKFFTSHKHLRFLGSSNTTESTNEGNCSSSQISKENVNTKCILDWNCYSETNLSYPIILGRTTLDKVYSENPDVETGGSWKSTECVSTWKIALIVVLRDREEQLKIFLRNIIPFLKKQKADFSLFVVEQLGDEIFNRGQSIDAGFIEAQKLGEFDCFIFHDIDMLPINWCNIYRCEKDGVRHLGISRDLQRPHIVWKLCIGGAVAFTKEQFESINGFTSVFFGWGGEDDDAYIRIKMEKILLHRYDPTVGNYLHLKHEKFHTKNFPRVNRGEEIHSHWKYRKYDGLNSMTYKVTQIQKSNLFTRIQITIPGPKTSKQLQPYLMWKRKSFQNMLERDNK